MASRCDRIRSCEHRGEVTHSIWQDGPARRAPSREALESVLDGLIEAIFPRHYGRSDIGPESVDYFVGNTLNIALNALLEQVHRGELFVSQNEPSEGSLQNAIELTRTFASALPAIRGVLVSDLRAAFVGDPAATNFPEILIGYPGMTAIIHHRLAHILYSLGANLVARSHSGDRPHKNRNRHSPGRNHRTELLYRSRDRSCHRRDRHYRGSGSESAKPSRLGHGISQQIKKEQQLREMLATPLSKMTW